MSASSPTVRGSLLFVSSPTARCGTTLVQRLLNSSPGALVFGEGVGSALVELARSLAGAAGVLERAEQHRRDLERALCGEQFWYPHLLGDPEGFVGLFSQALERFARFHAESARSHGRGLWGTKLPTVPMDRLRALLRVLPDARLVYVVRDLFAAARSAKARRFLSGPGDFERFAELWGAGVAGAEGLRGDPRVLVLEYERLDRRDPRLLSELEAFTGARGLDPAVLAARVNTWEGSEDEGRGPDQYVAPVELTADELAILERGAAAA